MASSAEEPWPAAAQALLTVKSVSMRLKEMAMELYAEFCEDESQLRVHV